MYTYVYTFIHARTVRTYMYTHMYIYVHMYTYVHTAKKIKNKKKEQNIQKEEEEEDSSKCVGERNRHACVCLSLEEIPDICIMYIYI